METTMLGDSLGESIATLGSVDSDEIDWENVRQTTVLIHQTFRYDYPGPIAELRQRLMVVPPDRHGLQRLVTHKLRVSGWNLDSERHYDTFGNVVLDLTLQEVDLQVEFATWAVVECDAPPAGRESSGAAGFDHRFGEPSRLTRPDAALRIVADEAVASGARELELAELLGHRVHDHFMYEWGVTSIETTAAEAWAAARGVCQDYAHCMLALCRLCGVPARYVSGHLLGEGGTHAWVEVLVQDQGGAAKTVPLDPTHDRRAGARYITVAIGRDYADVAPTSGTYQGSHPGALTTHKRAAVTRVDYL
jgi:transglutaminase-like putative cysteine protease